MTTAGQRDPLTRVLDGLDPATIESAAARSAEPFNGSRRIVIFGTAQLGRLVLGMARRAGLEVCAFADNNRSRWGTEIDGIALLPPADALAQYNGDAAFVVAIFNGSAVRNQLAGMGCRRIASYPAFFRTFPEFAAAQTGLALPGVILARRDAIQRAYGTLGDARSREEFATQIEWRCTLDYSALPLHSDGRDTYFDPEVVVLTAEEKAVDCGAFNGDTLRMFLKRTEGRFARFYALEPDPSNRLALSAYVASLPDPRRITVLPYAVGARDETVRFNAELGPASSMGADAGIEVECKRLDDIIDDDVTFIKMDIEGAEPFALQGAANLIGRSRPVLAVCAYHHCEHLWELPALMKSLLPEYRIHLRRYAEECWETVYYAVPPERELRP